MGWCDTSMITVAIRTPQLLIRHLVGQVRAGQVDAGDLAKREDDKEHRQCDYEARAARDRRPEEPPEPEGQRRRSADQTPLREKGKLQNLVAS